MHDRSGAPPDVRLERVNGLDYIRGEDLAGFLLGLDPNLSSKPEAREALTRFQAEAAALEPSARYRRAVALLNALGAGIPASLQGFRPRGSL